MKYITQEDQLIERIKIDNRIPVDAKLAIIAMKKHYEFEIKLLRQAMDIWIRSIYGNRN